MNKRKSIILTALLAISLSTGCGKSGTKNSSGTSASGSGNSNGSSNSNSSSTTSSNSSNSSSTTPDVIGFNEFLLAAGTSESGEGTLRFNATANRGIIHWALTEEADEIELTEDEIMLGSAKGIIKFGDSGAASVISNLVISGLEPEIRYTIHGFATDGTSYTSISTRSREAFIDIENRVYGSGTISDPWLIYSVKDLASIGKPHDATEQTWELTEHYKLALDINLSITYGEGKLSWSPIADDADSCFYGTFDGDGHTIKGLYINVNGDMGTKRPGLFSASQGTIKNLTLLDSFVDYTGLTDPSSSNVDGAILVAYLRNGGVVENINIVNGYVNSYVGPETTRTGALVGRVANTAIGGAIIRNNYVEAQVYGSSRAGGIVGYATNNSIIQDNVFIGSVFGMHNNSRVGGIVGYANLGVTIKNNIAIGYIDGVNIGVGGIVGYAQAGTTANLGLTLTITNNIFQGKVFSETTSATTVHYDVGQVASTTAGYTLINENNYYLEGSIGDKAATLTATLLEDNDLIDSNWLAENGFGSIEGEVFTSDYWVIKDDNSRITLETTLDQGIIESPLLVIAAITPDESNEKKATLRIRTNDEDIKISTIVLSDKENISVETIKEQSSSALAKAENQDSIKLNYTSNEYAAQNYAYYFLANDEEESSVYRVNGLSQKKEALTLTLNATSGTNIGDLDVSVKSNKFEADIHYIISKVEYAYTKTEIMNAVIGGNILAKETILATNSLSNNNKTFELENGETYYVYVYGIANNPTREVEVDVTGKAKSGAALGSKLEANIQGYASTTGGLHQVDDFYFAGNGNWTPGDKPGVLNLSSESEALGALAKSYAKSMLTSGANRTIKFTTNGPGKLVLIAKTNDSSNMKLTITKTGSSAVDLCTVSSAGGYYMFDISESGEYTIGTATALAVYYIGFNVL